MKFNVAQALAILAVTNPAVALQSTDYADNLAIVARDVNPEAATALASVLEARDPRGRSGGSRRTGSSRMDKAVGGAQIIAAGSEVANNAHQISQNGQTAAKRDIEAREPKEPDFDNPFKILKKTKQQKGPRKGPGLFAAKRDIEARDPRGRSGGSRRTGSSRMDKAVGGAQIIAAGSEVANNAHQISQNGQTAAKRDIEAREPKEPDFDNPFKILKKTKQQKGLGLFAAKRDIEARDPRRGGRSGGPIRTDKLVGGAQIIAAGSEVAKNGHEIYQNSKTPQRDLEARDPRRGGRSGGSGRTGGSRMDKAVGGAEIIASGSEVVKNGHEIYQNSKTPKRDPRRRGSFQKKLAAGKSIGASVGQVLGNVQTIGLNHMAGQQQQQPQPQPQPDQTAPAAKRDIEARDPRGRSGGSRRTGSSRMDKAVGGAQIIAAGSEAAKNAHQIYQNSQPAPAPAAAKRDIEAREPRRGGSRRTGGGGGNIIGPVSEVAKNAHEIYQNSQPAPAKRDIEAREPRRSGSRRTGGGGGFLKKAVDIGNVVAPISEVAKNAHEIYQNSKPAPAQ